MSPRSPVPADFGPFAVRVAGVEKAYRRGTTASPVLEGVDLDVSRGECVFLAGPSGSGKTTLLSIIGCILSPDRGRVEVLGQDLQGLDAVARSALRRDRIGFVFQRFHLIHGLSALDNVCVPLTLQGARPRAAQQRGLALLEAVGLADQAHAQPRNLSAGQCQRVAVARALANDPDLILADEPTAALDAANGHEMMQLLRRLINEHRKTAVVVTHDPRIFSFADRVCYLENGCIARTVENAPPLPSTGEGQGVRALPPTGDAPRGYPGVRAHGDAGNGDKHHHVVAGLLTEPPGFRGVGSPAPIEST
jgi:putative ABC transport system ATP-binding protein